MDIDTRKYLGKRIKEVRKSQGYTQEQLAEAIGIETTSLSGIESGRHYPSMPTLNKIADYLHVKTKALFEFYHFQDRKDMEAAIVKYVHRLSDKEIRYIYRFVEDLDD